MFTKHFCPSDRIKTKRVQENGGNHVMIEKGGDPWKKLLQCSSQRLSMFLIMLDKNDNTANPDEDSKRDEDIRMSTSAFNLTFGFYKWAIHKSWHFTTLDVSLVIIYIKLEKQKHS